MDYRKAGALGDVLVIASVVVVFMLYGFSEINVWFYLVLATSISLLIAGIVVKVAFYRCPHCHKWLPFRKLTPPDYCCSCGKKLESNSEL